MGQYLLAVSVTSQSGKVAFPFDKSALIQTIEAARDVSVRDWALDLGARGMPILVLRGVNSLVWSHEEFEAERGLFSSMPNVVFEEFENAGHGLPFEQRVKFVARIRQFVKSESDRRS